MTKRTVPVPAPEDPLVPIEYLLGLMGWKSRSTYYNRLKLHEPGFPQPVPVGTRNKMLVKSQCDAFQRAVIDKALHPAGQAGEEAAPADNGSSQAGASLSDRVLKQLMK